jgi:alcohol dehydrogenase class IV
MRAFTFDALPGRVVFGVGTFERLNDEVDRLGAARILVIVDPANRKRGDALCQGLGERCAGMFSDVQPHVPMEAARHARDEARVRGADCVVTLGGGSTTGLGKAIALESDIPTLAIPTTYAGSEMTPIYGITADGLKRTGRDVRVLPRTVIYDPALTVSLPASVTGPSGMNALAHCVEALYAKDANPVTSLMAEEGIRALARGIPAAVREPSNLEARTEAMYGAYLAGAALAVVGMAVHHRICHVLGGTFGLTHGDVNAVILPHAARFNQPAAPEALDRAARALGADDAAAGLFDLALSIGAPTSLAALGMREGDLAEAARLSADPPPWNPRPVEVDDVVSLLDDAFHGRRPAPASGRGDRAGGEVRAWG